MKVFKFGGASVKDASGVKNLIRVLEITGYKDTLVVVSAMGKTTNALENITERDINEAYAKADTGWFVSDICLTLGMIGTVAGFIYMLSSSFANIDVSNVSSLQGVLSHMSAGMATALYTTAAGLVSSAFLKLQYFNYSTEVDRLGTEFDDSEKT